MCGTLSILGACIIAGGVTTLDAGYTTDMPDKAVDANKVEHNIGHFYDDEQTNFRIKGHLIFDTNTRLDLGYDNGIDTAKYDVSEQYTVGVTQLFTLVDTQPTQRNGSGLFMTIGFATEFGGDVHHTPCIGDLGTEGSGITGQFYCGNLAPWSDFKQPENTHDSSANVTFTYKF